MPGFRILMYSSYFPPEYSGAALQALALAKQLRALGHQIEFVTLRWPGMSARDAIEGFPVTRLEAGRGTKHRELRLWWNLYRFLSRRRGDFDILHGHGAYYKDAVVGPMARHFGMCALSKASLAQNDLHDLSRSITGRIHRAMLRRVDACIAISRELQAEFIAGGISPAKVHHLPNGVDTARFRPADEVEKSRLRERFGLPSDRKIALFVGVLDERKNIAWLFDRWLEAKGFDQRAMLWAVGPCSRDDPGEPLKNQLASEAARHPDLLRLDAPIPDIEACYRAADVFVMPSRAEGLPNAVLEALASGLPCVAANVSGTNELIEEGKTGYLFELDDGNGLAAAMQAVFSEQRQSMAEAARQCAKQHYDIRCLAARYVDLYRAVCHRN